MRSILQVCEAVYFRRNLKSANDLGKTIQHYKPVHSLYGQSITCVRRCNKIIKHTIFIPGKRNALHGINNMLIKTGKETKPMFAGQWIIMLACIKIRHIYTSCFAAGQLYFLLKYQHIKTLFNKFCAQHSCRPRHRQ